MMRLIDADKFKKYLTEGTEEELKRRFLMGILTKEQEKNVDAVLADFLLDIDEQETVDLETLPIVQELRKKLAKYEQAESEARTVSYEADGYANGKLVYDTAYCPNCEHEFEEDDINWECNYCPECGKKLNWQQEE